MTHRYIKIGLTLAVLSGAFGFLLYTSLQGGTEYYKHVDEVMNNPSEWQGKPMQLHGFVVPGSIFRKEATFQYWFKLQNNGTVVAAAFVGIVPDTFKDESEVLLTGQLTADGFHTKNDGIMAKFPSKYEQTKKLG